MDYGPEYTSYKGLTLGLYGGKFYPLHKGHVEIALKASQEVDILFVVVQHDENHEHKLLEGTTFKHVSIQQRERWLSECFKDYPTIRVLSWPEYRCEDHLTNPKCRDEYIQLEAIIGKISKVFSCEEEYTKYFNFVLPHAEHVVYNKSLTVSASKIRATLKQHWEHLPDPVKTTYSKRVAFCGIESSGKSFTSKIMSQVFDSTLLEEYGREYFDKYNAYDTIVENNDLVNIACGHVNRLHELNSLTPLTILDTDMVYTQFFHFNAFGYLNPILSSMITSNVENIETRVYLEPYVFDDDGTRKRINDVERINTSKQLKDLYGFYGIPIHVVKGSSEDRLQTVEKLLTSLLEGE